MNYTRLADYNDGVQAQLAKLALDQAEIPCRVGDGDVLQSTLGSVTLYVAEVRAAEAREVLGWATLEARSRRLYLWTLLVDTMVLGPIGWFVARAVFS